MTEHFTYVKKRDRKYYWAITIFAVFIIILGLLILTSFYSNISFTGLITNKIADEIKPNSTIKFSAELTIPDLKIDGNFQNVELKGNSDSFMYVDSGKFQLNSKNNYMVLENYTGDISFNSEEITFLKGKSSKVFVNGIPIEPKTKSTLKTEVEKFVYSSLIVEKEVVIKKLTYTASGKINLNDGKNIFNIENEEISLEDFVGNLKIENDKITLGGYVKKLNIKGVSGISVSS